MTKYDLDDIEACARIAAAGDEAMATTTLDNVLKMRAEIERMEAIIARAVHVFEDAAKGGYKIDGDSMIARELAAALTASS